MRSLWHKFTRRRRLEREMRDELAFHIQARADDLARTGLTPAEAQRCALLEFGGIERYKEELRDTRRLPLIEDLLRDLAYACRNLRRSPLFALSAAGAIALGIAVNTALFSVAYGILFRPLPVHQPQTVRNIYMTTRGEGTRLAYGSRYFASFAEFHYLTARSHTVELAGVSEASLTARFAPDVLHAQLASENLLPMLGAVPAQGRFFTREECATPGGAAVAVLSYEAWQKYFHGDNVAGRSVVINRTPFTIVGVAARGFHGPLILKPDLWIPLTMQAVTRASDPLVTNPSAGWIQMLARVAPGTSDRKIQAELAVLAEQAVTAHTPAQHAQLIVSPGAFLNYPDVLANGIPVLAVLLFVFSLVLLAACANVANMLVGRGMSRVRELAIRLSLGAGRRRLIRQLLTEHMLLGLLGGIGGLFAAQVAVRSVMLAMPPLGENQLDFSPDWSIVLWTVLVALGAGLLFGLPAAISLTRADLAQAMRGDGKDIRGRGRTRLQSSLIAIQAAVSALLLINAGLLLHAARTAVRMDPGFALDHVLIARPNLRALQYEPRQAAQFLEALHTRVRALPGVSSVALTGFAPVTDACGSMMQPVSPEGAAEPSIRVSCHQIGPGFFHTMRIPLRQGRDIQASDLTAAADVPSSVAIISSEFARRYFGGNAVGRRLRQGKQEFETVGVAGATTPLVAVQPSYLEVYQPVAGTRYLEARLLIAYTGARAPLARAAQAAASQLDGEVLLEMEPIEQQVAKALSFVRLAAGAVAALGALALLLASAGIYGVVAFAVGRRRREIGLRLALGAPPPAVLRLLLRQSMRPVWIGSVIGAAAAAAGAQLLRSLLYGVSPLDPLGFTSALVVLSAVALLAAVIPARAALRVDPASTLRHE